ncbi:hypothetical protein ACHAW6_014515 [Cyclotella cf. meneghiniana]
MGSSLPFPYCISGLIDGGLVMIAGAFAKERLFDPRLPPERQTSSLSLYFENVRPFVCFFGISLVFSIAKSM